MIALRKFSVKVSADLISEFPHRLTADKVYPVIAITDPEENLALIANDLGELIWVEFDDCTVASIDD